MLGDLLSAAVKSPGKAVGPAALAGSTVLLLGQVKRANKIKKQVRLNAICSSISASRGIIECCFSQQLSCHIL
jgi:hypothetical protein